MTMYKEYQLPNNPAAAEVVRNKHDDGLCLWDRKCSQKAIGTRKGMNGVTPICAIHESEVLVTGKGKVD